MFVLFFVGADRVAEAPVSGGLPIAGSAVCLFTLLRIERRCTAPIVPTDLFAVPAFRFAAIASVCCFTGQTLGVIVLPPPARARHDGDRDGPLYDALTSGRPGQDRLALRRSRFPARDWPRRCRPAV
jgi:hypothetical protein